MSINKKLTPPEKVKHALMEHGCIVPRPNTPDADAIDLRENYVRYKKWCQSIVRDMDRKIKVGRKNVRKSKRAFAYGREDMNPKKRRHVSPVSADETDEEDI